MYTTTLKNYQVLFYKENYTPVDKKYGYQCSVVNKSRNFGLVQAFTVCLLFVYQNVHGHDWQYIQLLHACTKKIFEPFISILTYKSHKQVNKKYNSYNSFLLYYLSNNNGPSRDHYEHSTPLKHSYPRTCCNHRLLNLKKENKFI